MLADGILSFCFSAALNFASRSHKQDYRLSATDSNRAHNGAKTKTAENLNFTKIPIGERPTM